MRVSHLLQLHDRTSRRPAGDAVCRRRTKAIHVLHDVELINSCEIDGPSPKVVSSTSYTTNNTMLATISYLSYVDYTMSTSIEIDGPFLLVNSSMRTVNVSCQFGDRARDTARAHEQL
jgi:hypothetical protein